MMDMRPEWSDGGGDGEPFEFDRDAIEMPLWVYLALETPLLMHFAVVCLFGLSIVLNIYTLTLIGICKP